MTAFNVKPADGAAETNGAWPLKNGYTNLTPSVDTRIVYVSDSDGDDSNDGLSEGQAKKTIAAGLQLLRYNFPDWLLLKRGDTFTDQSFGQRTGAGRSEYQPMVFGAYGPLTSDRPRVEMRNSNGCFITVGSPPADLAGMCFRSIDLYNYGGAWFDPRFNTPSAAYTGIQWNAQTRGLTLEDLKVQCFALNLEINPRSGSLFVPCRNVRIRRTITANAWIYGSGTGHGLYMYNNKDIFFKESTFDHNGWGTSRDGPQGATILSHNIYLQNVRNNGVIYVGCINQDPAATGLYLRSGGYVRDSFFARIPVQNFGYPTGDETWTTYPDGVEHYIEDNVIIENNDTTSTTPRGMNVIYDCRKGFFRRNIVSKNISSTSNTDGLRIVGYSTKRIRNLAIDDNIWWNIERDGGPRNTNPAFAEFTTDNNGYYKFPVDGTNYDSETTDWLDPDRDADTYNASIGGPGTFEGWRQGILAQREGAWDVRYTAYAINDYIRGGFNQAVPSDSNDRRSALTLFPNWIPPTADGNIDLADRWHIAWHYRQRAEAGVTTASGTGQFAASTSGDITSLDTGTGTGTFTADNAGDFASDRVGSGTGTFAADGAGAVTSQFVAVAEGTGTFTAQVAGSVLSVTTQTPRGTGTFQASATGAVTSGDIVNAAGRGEFLGDSEGLFQSFAFEFATGTGTFTGDSVGVVVSQRTATATGRFNAQALGDVTTIPQRWSGRRTCLVADEERTIGV